MLSEIFSSDSRSEIFKLLFNGEKNEYYLREIERLSGKSIRSIQQEVQHLLTLDLISSRKDGNRIYYKANANHPIYPELVGIVEKTSGIVPLLKSRLNDSTIECAFIFGSFAKGKEGAESDIDLVVIGDLGMRALTKLLSGIQEKVGREINPHIYSKEDFRKKIKLKDHFVTSILKDEIKPILGNLDDYK